MCDCYAAKCEGCDREMNLHIADYCTPRENSLGDIMAREKHIARVKGFLNIEGQSLRLELDFNQLLERLAELDNENIAKSDREIRIVLPSGIRLYGTSIVFETEA